MSLQACTNPVPKVYTPALPVSRNMECKRCEMVVNIGLFFDGTGNNRDEDKPTKPKPGEKRSSPSMPIAMWHVCMMRIAKIPTMGSSAITSKELAHVVT